MGQKIHNGDIMHLIIAEKHIAAKRIANILSAGKLSQVRVNGVDTYQFQADDGAQAAHDNVEYQYSWFKCFWVFRCGND